MSSLFRDKKTLIIGIVVLIVVVAGGSFFVLSKKSSDTTSQLIEQEKILTMSPDEIGLVLTMGEDGKRVIMEIGNVGGLRSVEYQLSYTSEGDIPRGVIGTVDIEEGESVRKELVLGTCSDVCHYDEDIKDIKIILKVTKTDGKVYQVEKSL